MHRLTKFDIDESMQYRVDPRTIEIVKEMIDAYNEAVKLAEVYDNINISRYRTENGKIKYVPYGYNDDDNRDACDSDEDDMSENGEFIGNMNRNELYQAIIATCPQGLMKTMRVVTNALQLKSMIAQRSNHKLEEWVTFTKWAKSLYFWRYLDMYQDDLDIHKEDMELLGKMEYLLYHLMENHRYLTYDKDSPYELTHEIVGNDNGDCSLSRLVDKDDVGSISTYDAIKDITGKYSLSLYSTIGQLVSRFHALFLIYNTGKLMNENRELKEKVKTLEKYILQHAHGKISTEELCDKLNK